MKLWQSNNGIFMSQSKYAKDILQKYNMSDCKPLATSIDVGVKMNLNEGSKSVNTTLYQQLIGSLIYLTFTRPDIAYAVSLVSRFMTKPKEEHWKAVKRILRYIRRTINYGLNYTTTTEGNLVGYTDVDWVGDPKDKCSTSDYVFNTGSTAIAWSTKKQSTVSLSTTKIEYKATVAAACKAVWLRRVIQDLKEEQIEATQIYCDNQSTIQMMKNPVLYGRTKHIKI
eukprot:Gb_29540 [translate_table: standard]